MKIAIEEWELYNEGIILIKWFDTEIDSIEAIEHYVSKAKREHGLNYNDLEMFIADSEDELLTDIENVSTAYEITDKVALLDDSERTAIELILDNGVVYDLDDAINHIDDIHCTGESRMEDIAYNYVNDCGLLHEMPSSLQGYFDYEGLGRDMDIEGSYYEDADGILWEYVA